MNIQGFDWIFYLVGLFCFFCFLIEICLTFYCSPNYRWSFFFFLDVLSTASLLLDIGFISDAIGLSNSQADGAKSATQLARAARASRIGTRAGRIVRIIRLIRLIRVVKIYKASQQEFEKRDQQKSKKIKEDIKNKKKLKEKELGYGFNDEVDTPVHNIKQNENPNSHGLSGMNSRSGLLNQNEVNDIQGYNYDSSGNVLKNSQFKKPDLDEDQSQNIIPTLKKDQEDSSKIQSDLINSNYLNNLEGNNVGHGKIAFQKMKYS